MRWLVFAFQNTLRNRRRSLVTIAIAACTIVPQPAPPP